MIEHVNFPIRIPQSLPVLIPHGKFLIDEERFPDIYGQSIAHRLFEKYSDLLLKDGHYLEALSGENSDSLPDIDSFASPGDSQDTVKFQEGQYIYSIFNSTYGDIEQIRYCIGRRNNINLSPNEKFDLEKHIDEMIRIVIKKSDIEDESFIMTEGFNQEGENLTFYHNSAAEFLIENVYDFREGILERRN